MANFGDELRNALNQTAQETHVKNHWSEAFEQDNGSIVPEIDSALSELISYHVSVEDASRFLGEKYLGFRIKATW